MINDYSSLNVNDTVAVARPGSWQIHSEGIYRVVKVNKLKVVVERESDGYQRVFSVKRRCEMCAGSHYRAAYLESVDSMLKREAQLQRERDVRAAWADVEQAGRVKSWTALQAAVSKLQKLVDC